jgi:hypothetical protein
MSRRTESRKLASIKRVEGRFLAIPHDVLDSWAYLSLSHTAKSLLLEVGRQYMSQNNGMLVLSLKYLKKRGWNSSDVITRAKRELLAKGFIYETVMGHRPNKASRYAVTWATLDPSRSYDFGVEKGFVRGAYRNFKNETLIPCSSKQPEFIVPSPRLNATSFVPPTGTVAGAYRCFPIP